MYIYDTGINLRISLKKCCQDINLSESQNQKFF